MGLFVTRNKKQLASIAKFSDRKPSEMLQQAYMKIGKHKPITAYRNFDGTIVPIGRTAPEKPKWGWINLGTKKKPIWEKSSDPQTGVFDKWYQKIEEMHLDAFGRRKGPSVEIVTE